LANCQSQPAPVHHHRYHHHHPIRHAIIFTWSTTSKKEDSGEWQKARANLIDGQTVRANLRRRLHSQNCCIKLIAFIAQEPNWTEESGKGDT
jgi:hypothetical protein